MIGQSSFEYSDGVTDVYFAGSRKQWEEIAFGPFNGSLFNANIHYNCMLVNILTLPDSLNIIDPEAFTGLPAVDAIRIPASVSTIASDAFDPGMILLVPTDSAWVTWAENNGYVAIEE